MSGSMASPAALGRGARLVAVRFSPGARTAWHCHANGQTLHMKSGQGLIQTRAGHTIAMLPGDTVYTPPGIWHWHGAMPGSFMTHLALADSSAEPGAPMSSGASSSATSSTTPSGRT
jgi:quercetin dioxygenase-like cupin family protein